MFWEYANFLLSTANWKVPLWIKENLFFQREEIKKYVSRLVWENSYNIQFVSRPYRLRSFKTQTSVHGFVIPLSYEIEKEVPIV